MYKSLVIISTRKEGGGDIMRSIPSDAMAKRIKMVKVANRRGREIPSYNTAHRHSWQKQ